ncbi:L,D-transpeptidase [Oceanospirillum maris]|uniref:L,D-transpeptidase n=1 Tax=Oceanospirillum maris TaxID=64977 RepID=UPI000420BB76|nr:L,D-transpeptidase [Oceanospirillum maris]
MTHANEEGGYQPALAPDWSFFATSGHWLQVDISHQKLYVIRRGIVELSFPVSTGLNGVGEEEGSGQTPLGWHLVRAKIGQGHPANAVYRGRRWTGECYTEQLGRENPDRDWILGRILWLSGLELGRNRLGNRDTMRRYIYLHGTPDTEPMGIAQSHGCIRMRLQDIVLLFEVVPVYLPVYIGNV